MPNDPKLDQDDRLVAMLGAFIAVGALAGATVSALLLGSAHWTLEVLRWVGYGLIAITAATAGIGATAAVYADRAWSARRLDGRVGRTLPIAAFFLAALVAAWTRLAVTFPAMRAIAFSSGLAVGVLLAASLWYLARGTNRLSRVFAAMNAWQYGVIAAGLVLVGHPFPLMGLAVGIELFAVALGLQRNRIIDPGLLGGASSRVPVAVPLVAIAVALGLYLTALAAPRPVPQRSCGPIAVGEAVDHSACRAAARF